MPTYEVRISEAIERTPTSVRPSERTPEVRSVDWRGEAADEQAARLSGWRAWDEKYGAGRQPADAIVELTPVAA